MGDQVRGFLWGAHLQDYVQQFKEQGYTRLQQITSLDIPTLGFIARIGMEPEDVLQLQTVLLKLKRLPRSPAKPLPLTRADSVAENVGTAIAQQIPRGNIDMPAAIANVVAPYTALRTDTGLGMPNFNVGMPTSLDHLDYPVNTVPTGSTNVPEPPIDIPVTVAPNTIPDAGLGMPRGNSPDLRPIVRPKRMWSFPPVWDAT